MIDRHSWRARYRPIIAEVVGVFAPGDDVRYVRKAVLASFPDPPRANHPYRIYLDETRRQLAAFKARQDGYPVPPRGKALGPAPAPPDPRQPELFDDADRRNRLDSRHPVAGGAAREDGAFTPADPTPRPRRAPVKEGARR